MSTSLSAADAVKARTFEQMLPLATWLAEQDELLLHRLIEARRAAGLTQRDVAEMLEIKQSSVASFERHDNDPRLSTIRRYALAVDCAVTHEVTEARTVARGSGWITADGPREFSVTHRARSQVAISAPAESQRTDFAVAA